MQPDERLQQLRAAFSGELEERIRSLNQLLLRLERNGGGDRERPEILDALFRDAHSLKGAARAVEVPQVEQLSHALESALDRVRQSGGHPSAQWFDAAYSAADMLAELNQSLQDPAATQPPEYQTILAALGAAEPEKVASKPRHPDSAPSTTSGDRGSAPPPELEAISTTRPENRAATAPSSVETASRPLAESVRVAVSKLDKLLTQAGELTVAHIRIDQRLSELGDLRHELEEARRDWRKFRLMRSEVRQASSTSDLDVQLIIGELDAMLRFTETAEKRAHDVSMRVDQIATQFRDDAAQLGLAARAIQEDVMAVRLLPVATIFSPFERMVRDLAREKGKEIALVIEGADTEIDRKILEQLRDPLMHMLRNAVDHGIEAPPDREALGKPYRGTIRLAALQRGNVISIVMADDGRGLDPDHIRERATSKGFLMPEQAASTDDRSAIELIFLPGFSTVDTVTETSGRGVGMDVVREHVERLNGHIDVSSEPGRGTRFTIDVPLTLATSRAILIVVGGQVFAVPSAMVERTGRTRQDELVTLEGRQAVKIDGHPIPAVELASVLERPSASERPGSPWRTFFVLRQGERRAALLVDELVGEQEIVVKSLGWPLTRVRNVGGATVLGSGQAVVILNPIDLMKAALGARHAMEGASVARLATPVKRHKVLVVDDSLTVRTLERSILEAAGYEVLAATDGVDALRLLRADTVDVIVSDVEMPRLDGFGLTAEVRRDEKLRQTPVVLVTSLDAREHRERGVAVGADAYIVKSGFDQGQLLDTIRRLL